MKLNKSNAMKLFEAAFDMSHDGTGKQVFVTYSPHVGSMQVDIYLNGWKAETRPDTSYVLYEGSDGYFQQACDADDIAEALQAMIGEGGKKEHE